MYLQSFNGNRSVPFKLMSDSEYSVIKNGVIKSFDCTKFEVATSNRLGGDTFTRNVTDDGHTDGQTTDQL